MRKIGPCLGGGLRPRWMTTHQRAIAPLILFYYATLLIFTRMYKHIADHSTTPRIPAQADVVTFKAFNGAPDAEKYPHVARWYKHIASYESEFSTLPGDSSKAFTAYGPETTELPSNPKDKPEEDDDEDLFGSDSEEEDAEVVAERNKRLEEYKAKKANKPKPAAKSLVTMEVKPWGMYIIFCSRKTNANYYFQMTRPTLRSSRLTSAPLRRTALSGVPPSGSRRFRY